MSLKIDMALDAGDEGMALPITPRGMFAQDPFFSSFKPTYDSAIGDVLNRWSDRVPLTDRLASYRRQRSMAPEPEVISKVSQADDKYTIVLDMNEFVSGEMTVRTVDRAALVEAKNGPKSYKRSFPLPNDTDWDKVATNLSDDGIMTITAPRKSGSRKSSVVGIQPTGEVVEEAVQARNVQQQESGPRKQSRSIPMFVEGIDGPSAEEMLSTAMEGLGAPFLPSRGSSRIATSSYFDRTLPISRKGRFFQDKSFERLWKDFDTALDEHMDKDKKTSSSTDEGSKSSSGDKTDSYKNLRQHVVQDDSQAATITSGEEGYRIVVDVADFADGNLTVKGVQGAVIVKGSKGGLSFKRTFTLPGLTKPEEVVASLSADGVLSITAPK
ncbi:unnamed protein product [Meganyctiphanes norvegica]|uniref:SHSP domain-containing protein n=1 Tax=Meganyctiphanes norvegica TaxID=48144 RepID=A0AAV2QU42_MEGNR